MRGLEVQLTARDAAALLGITERQIYGYIDDGEIPFFRVQDQYRFNRTELLEWALTRRLPVQTAFLGDEEGTDAARTSSLARALAAGGVHHGVPGSDRESALREVVARMPVGSDDDRELVYGILIARENCGSTAVGDGIAIPHVRSPVVSGTSAGSITLCTLEKPVAFGAPDKQPVHTIFTIVSPTIQAHLMLLGKLASALHQPAFREAVLARAPAAAILDAAERAEAGAAAPKPAGTAT